MVKTTREQRRAIARLAERWNLGYREVRQTALAGFGMPGVVIIPPNPANRIWIGIEPDGYAHS